MKIQSLMTRKVITVREHTPVAEVARCMSKHDISGIPVLDAEDRLVGIITEIDLIVRNGRLELPAFLQIFDASIPLELPSHLRERLQHMFGTEAKDIMTEKVHSVNVDTELEELIELMTKKHVNPVPVLEEGRLVGIVSRSDLVRMMATEI